MKEPVIGQTIYARPVADCIISGRPDEGIVVAIHEVGSHGRIVTIEPPNHDTRRVWLCDYITDPPDPNALFQDHYL